MHPNEEMNTEPGLPTVREVCWVSALLAVFLLLFFSIPTFRSEILSPADLLLKSEPWRQSAAPDFEPANALLSDYVFQMRPWRSLAISSLKDGQIPLWDPYNYAGAPFLANGQSAVLFPLNLLFVILPDAVGTLLGAMARLFIAGLSAYLFARVIGLGVLGASIAGLGFSFSGFQIVWLLSPHVNVAIWLPALFLGTEAIVRRPTAPRMVALAAVVCIQFLGGHPETSLHMLSAISSYACWRAAMTFKRERNWPRVMRRLAIFAAALLLGTAGAAVQLMPLGAYILESATLRGRLDQALPLWSLPQPRFLAMLALVCPYCFGSHLRGDLPLGVFLGVGNFNELNGGYVGLISLVLVTVAIALGNRRGLDLFFLLLGGAAFCVALAIPPVFNVIGALPLFRVSINTRLLLILAFALSVLAGRGADLLMIVPAARARQIVKRVQLILILGIGGVAIVAASLLLVATTFREKILDEARNRIVSKVQQGETFQQNPEHYIALLPSYYDRLIRLLFREGTGRVVLLALTSLAISLTAKRGKHRRSLAWTLPAVLILDLFSFGRNYNPSIDPKKEFPSHGALEFLQQQPGLFRILWLDGGLPPNTNLIYGLQEVRGYNALETEAYQRFLSATGAYTKTLYFSNFESRLVDLLNVKFVISDRQLRNAKLTPVLEGPIRVYENRAVLPRAFLVYRTLNFTNEHELDRALRDPGFDPGTVVLLQDKGPTLSGPDDPASKVRITTYQAEHIVIEVSSRYEGILLLADAWSSGWVATIDEIPAQVFRGDLLFRAVSVPAGKHQVIFRYRPASFRHGVIISGVAFFIALCLLAGPPLRGK